MSVVLPQLRKDVRHHAWWLLSWTAAAALPLGVLALRPYTSSDWLDFNLARAPRFVLFVLLTAHVVQDDPLTETTAFWLTRPISGRALLASKLLYVGGLLVLPIAGVEAVLVAAAGASPWHAVLAALEVFLLWSAWGALVFGLASLSSTLPGLLSAGFKVCLVAAAIALCTAGSLGLARHLGWLGPTRASAPAGATETGETFGFALRTAWIVATSLAGIGLALAVAWAQFVWRRLGRAWDVVAGSLLCAIALQLLWLAVSTGIGARGATGPTAVDASTVDVAIGSIDRFEIAPTERRSTTYRAIRGDVSVSGVPAPFVGEIEDLAGATITFPDGDHLYLDGRPEPGEETWDPTAVERLLDGVRLVNVVPTTSVRRTIVRATLEQYARHAGKPGHLMGPADVRLRRYRVGADLPLRPGPIVAHEMLHASLDWAQLYEGWCAVAVRTTQVSLLLVPETRWAIPDPESRADPDGLYILVNGERREAFWPHRDQTRESVWISKSRVYEARTINQYARPGAAAATIPAIDEAWFANARLVRIEAETVGRVWKTLDDPAFVLP